MLCVDSRLGWFPWFMRLVGRERGGESRGVVGCEEERLGGLEMEAWIGWVGMRGGAVGKW